MKEILGKFNNSYVVQLKGVSKDTYFESYENGEGEYNGSFGIEYLDKEFVLIENEFTKEKLTDLILQHLRSELVSDLIEKDWIYIENDYIAFSTYEIDNSQYTEIIVDVKEQEDRGNQVYSCFYQLELYINGQRISEEDLVQLLDFEN